MNCLKHPVPLPYQLLLCCVLAAALVAGCKPGEQAESRQELPPVAVRTAKAALDQIAETLQFTGELASPLTVEVASKIQGRLEKLALASGADVTEGMAVQAGDVLAEIDHRDLEARLALACAQVQQSEATLADKARERRRLEALFAEEVATEQARDAAVAAHEIAVASLAQAVAQQAVAQANLDDSFIHAPMDGVVAARYLDPGAMVGVSAPIVRLVQMNPLRLMVSIPAHMLPLVIPKKTPVRITTSAYPDRLFESVVERVFPTVDQRTRTAQVEILLSNESNGNGHWLLRPGMYATAEIQMALRESTLMIPASSVLRVLERQIVFLIKDGAASTTTVKTGIRSGDKIEILEGMQAGDEYVTIGQNKLTDGARIERVED